MPIERWGSLSVDDHVDAHALVANVLLYDRLILPVMTPQVDRDERAYWAKHGWDPELQQQRLEQLGELAIERPWDKTRRSIFRTRAEQIAAEKGDAASMDAKHLTRMILAQEAVVEKPKGVHRVVVVAAYNSATSINQDFHVADAAGHLAAQAYLLSRRLAVPDLPDPEKSLDTAIELSRNRTFRRKRSKLFDWQELAIDRRWTPEETVDRLSILVDDYNAAVKDAASTVRWRFAFTIFGIGLGFVTGDIVGAAASASLSLLQLTKLDRQPAIDAGSAEPAAMFHDVKARLGLPLKSVITPA